MRRPPGRARLCDRQRDPGFDRALARAPANREVPGRALPRGDGGRSRHPGHVRQLSLDRIPPAPVSRSRLLQRLPRSGRGVRGLPGTVADPRGQSPARHHRAGARRPAKRRRGAGRFARLAAADGFRRGLRRRLRLRVDGRVEPRRRRHRRLAFRSDSCRPIAQAALAAVEEAFASAPLRLELDWPRISVVVCTHNGAATIAECLEAALRSTIRTSRCS